MKGTRACNNDLIAVSGEEFQKAIREARLGEISFLEIHNYYKFLNGKLIHGDVNSIDEIPCRSYLCGAHLKEVMSPAQRVFVAQITKRSTYCSYYGKTTETYIRSNTFSNAMKKCILHEIEGLDNTNKANQILKSEIPFNDLNPISLRKIEMALSKCPDNTFLEAFERYMFVLNGDGPIEYIKSKYSDKKELALSFLVNLGIDLDVEEKSWLEQLIEDIENGEKEKTEKPPEEELSNGLLVEFLIALAALFHKYLPEEQASFISFVEKGDFLTHREFVTLYKRFVREDFEYETIAPSKYQYRELTYVERRKEEDKAYLKATIKKANRMISYKNSSLEGTIKKLVYGTESPKKTKN